MSAPLAYLLTFTCYGQWLHGDERGSVDSAHRVPGTDWVAPQRGYHRASLEAMREPAYVLTAGGRDQVLAAVRQVCLHRGWRLWAAHVRSQHVHVVVTASDVAPEKVMGDLKAYATRALKRLETRSGRLRRWTRHGSTRYLNRDADVERAVRYVLFEQGPPQAVWDGRDAPRPVQEPAP